MNGKRDNNFKQVIKYPKQNSQTSQVIIHEKPRNLEEILSIVEKKIFVL